MSGRLFYLFTFFAVVVDHIFSAVFHHTCRKQLLYLSFGRGFPSTISAVPQLNTTGQNFVF